MRLKSLLRGVFLTTILCFSTGCYNGMDLEAYRQFEANATPEKKKIVYEVLSHRMHYLSCPESDVRPIGISPLIKRRCTCKNPFFMLAEDDPYGTGRYVREHCHELIPDELRIYNNKDKRK